MNNSSFEIKDSESSGGNISSFRNVASDLLDGQMAPSVSATAFRGARYPSLIDVRSLWLELGQQARRLDVHGWND